MLRRKAREIGKGLCIKNGFNEAGGIVLSMGQKTAGYVMGLRDEKQDISEQDDLIVAQ